MTPIHIAAAGEALAGGWLAQVPQVRFFSDDHAALTRKYEGEGMGRAAAQARADDICQQVFESGWLAGLRQAIRRWATQYYDATGTLDGFQPERMAVWFAPFDNTGRAGKPGADRELQQMIEEGKDA